MLSPEDAQERSIREGDPVRVFNDRGDFEGFARVTDDVVPGAVSIPHGLVDQNVSVLTSSSAGTTDALTGMVLQSGIPITIRAQEPPSRSR